ncbi:hypothetical protein A0H81_09067 [Grifola frondosa]|uniref:Uncharacterized protein n=1 Tax=Grifola frondosa TaxID=5627 RepID=A0A1C7M1K8_GRIFR|nr:hypothetical protein A0H81_09067 [Grifola frondosa]
MASPEDPYDSEASHGEDTPEGGTSLHGGPAPTFPVALPAGGRDGSAMITPADKHEADMSSLDTVRRPASSASLLESQDVVFLTESAESHRTSIQGGAEAPTGLKRKISTESSEHATSEDDITSPDLCIPNLPPRRAHQTAQPLIPGTCLRFPSSLLTRTLPM